jgi:hypothetical protein
LSYSSPIEAIEPA